MNRRFGASGLFLDGGLAGPRACGDAPNSHLRLLPAGRPRSCETGLPLSPAPSPELILRGDSNVSAPTAQSPSAWSRDLIRGPIPPPSRAKKRPAVLAATSLLDDLRRNGFPDQIRGRRKEGGRRDLQRRFRHRRKMCRSRLPHAVIVSRGVAIQVGEGFPGTHNFRAVPTIPARRQSFATYRGADCATRDARGQTCH